MRPKSNTPVTTLASGLFTSRDASGTAWLPDASPMYGVEVAAGAWSVMLHGNAFVQFLNEGGTRAAQQGGSINWAMAMARRRAGSGRVGLRTMFSLEPWTIRGCGYPDLLATGEVCDGEPIHDRQHPHDLIMELAAEYSRPLAGARGGTSTAVLPASRRSARQHFRTACRPCRTRWRRSRITGSTPPTSPSASSRQASRRARGKSRARCSTAGSPTTSGRISISAPLDSVSGRIWYLPTPQLALQVSAAHLEEAEAGHGTGVRADVDRVTASATYQRPLGPAWQWASTMAFGANREAGVSTAALLVETSFSLRDRDTWFGRFEWVEKSADDLGIHFITAIYDVAKLQLGYTAYFPAWRRLTPGFGGSVSVGFVPPSLTPFYGHRANPGVALFLTIRPAAHHMQH